MTKDLWISAVLFAVVAIGSWAARNWGFYNEYWYTDVILHLIAGMALGFLATAFDRREKRRLGVILISIGAAVLGSFLWEVWEFAGWRIMPAHTRFYTPELADSLSDMACGLAGGLALGVWKAFRY